MSAEPKPMPSLTPASRGRTPTPSRAPTVTTHNLPRSHPLPYLEQARLIVHKKSMSVRCISLVPSLVLCAMTSWRHVTLFVLWGTTRGIHRAVTKSTMAAPPSLDVLVSHLNNNDNNTQSTFTSALTTTPTTTTTTTTTVPLVISSC